MELEHAYTAGQGFVVGDEHRAFGTGHVLDRMEREDRRALRTDVAPLVAGAGGVGGMAAGIAAGLGAGAFWGTTFVAPLVAPGFSSVDYTAGRFIACGLFSLAWMLWQTLRMPSGQRAGQWPDAAQAGAALWLSVLGYTGYYLLLVYGIADAGAALPALIIGTLPVWMMLLGKPAHLRWAALLPGLLLTAAGMVLMMDATSEEVNASGAGNFWRGVLLAWGEVGGDVGWVAQATRPRVSMQARERRIITAG